jgi:hypothetical protein
MTLTDAVILIKAAQAAPKYETDAVVITTVVLLHDRGEGQPYERIGEICPPVRDIVRHLSELARGVGTLAVTPTQPARDRCEFGRNLFEYRGSRPARIQLRDGTGWFILPC